MMTRVFLGLGSNVGNREGYLRAALAHISKLPQTHLLESSPVYETEPVGDKDQPEFLNIVVEISTALEASDLHKRLKEAEASLGRTGRRRWGPREIDIDVLYFGTVILDGKDLRIPHPERMKRRFVLEPMVDLAPDLKDPESGLTVRELLQQCPDRTSVRRSAIGILKPLKE